MVKMEDLKDEEQRYFDCSSMKSEEDGNVNQSKQLCHKDIVCLDKRYSCDQCDERFAHQSSLSYHKRGVHLGIRHSCDQCEKTYSTPSSLLNHKRSVHLGIRDTCDSNHMIVVVERP